MCLLLLFAININEHVCILGRQESNFDLVFDRNVQGYAESHLDNELSAFTLAFWMKGSKEDLEAGTVASYAVNVGSKYTFYNFKLHKSKP